MSQIHVVILDDKYARTHMGWMKDFVFSSVSENTTRHIFACASYEMAEGYFMQFDVIPKSAKVEDCKKVVIPLTAVAAILRDNEREKIPFGFSLG